MCAAGCIINQPGLAGICCLKSLHTGNGLICQVGCEIISRLVDPWKYLSMVLEQIGCPLICFSSLKSVEVLKAHAGWPLVEGPGHTINIIRCIVIFSKPGCCVSVSFKDISNGTIFGSHDGIISGITGRQFGYNTEAGGMMVATRQQCCTCGRTKSGRAE